MQAMRQAENSTSGQDQQTDHPASSGLEWTSYVLPWLDWSELRQVRMACDHLPENVHHRQLSLSCRHRRVWRDLAPEDANDILAHWNKKTESASNKRSSHITRHPVDNQKRYANVGAMFCAAPQSTSFLELRHGLL